MALSTIARPPPTVTPSDDPTAPIALFDSGVGGLTVLSALWRRRPEESLAYVADQAHVPYGGRPLDEIRGLAEALVAHAFRSGAKMVVMACNASSATYGPAAQEAFGQDRVLGVVEPGARLARQKSRSGRIGVLGTEGTVLSHAYPAAFQALDERLSVVQVACPRFVPLVEAGELDGWRAEAAVREALGPLVAAGVDTVVLGCTHYPYLLPVLRRLAPSLAYVDPAEATADEVIERLGARACPPGQRPMHHVFTTGDVFRFEEQARPILEPLGIRCEARPLRWTARRAA